MEKGRHLGGNGIWAYDSVHDLLLLKVNGRLYKRSLEFENFVLDIDGENFVTGVRVFDASKVFNLNKELLERIKELKFKASVQEGVLNVSLDFISRSVPEKHFNHQLSLQVEDLEDSYVECVFA